MKNYSNKFVGSKKASFNRIQSWLEQIQSVENTQRMLLNGGTKKFEGFKLKSKNSKARIKPSFNNIIEVNNQSKVFRISSYQEQNKFSRTFMPSKKQRIKLNDLIIHSECSSPRESKKRENLKMLSTGFPRQTFKLNTKQLQFKMKKIKRVQSASQIKDRPSNKQKIAKILSWKGELVQIQKQQKDKSFLNIHKNIKTSPSSPKNRMNEQEMQIDQKDMTNNIFSKSDAGGKLQRNLSIQQSKLRKKPHGKQINKAQKLDSRIQLQLHIAHKLFHMQDKNKKFTFSKF